jgi:cation diffusion facilitator family transporter
MQWIRNYTPQPGRKELYTQALLITVLGNILLASSKAVAAYLSGSVALYADAANSISDVLYSLLMVLGLWVAQQPPDLSHPQGHSRFEPLVGLMVSFSMAFAGYAAIRAAYSRFMTGAVAVDPGLPTLVLIGAAVVKFGMFWAITRLAKKLNSPTLETTAKDNLSDVLTSTAAFVGILGSKFIAPISDPIAAVLVAAWIFRAAFGAAKQNLEFLTGAGASPELRQEIVTVAEAVPGVLRVHHTMTEYVGPTLVVDLHINVNGKTSLNDVHKISDEVARRLEALPEVDRAYVHVEPDNWE